MQSKYIIAIVAAIVAFSSLISSNLVLYIIIGEINRDQSQERERYFGFAASKFIRIFSRYRSIYPSGKLHVWFVTLCLIAAVGLATSFLVIAE